MAWLSDGLFVFTAFVVSLRAIQSRDDPPHLLHPTCGPIHTAMHKQPPICRPSSAADTCGRGHEPYTSPFMTRLR